MTSNDALFKLKILAKKNKFFNFSPLHISNTKKQADKGFNTYSPGIICSIR